MKKIVVFNRGFFFSLSRIMNYTPDMSRESVDRAIYHALLIWSYPSQLRFRQANDLEHPDIEFLFAQGYHKDGYQFDGKG